jgi:hypothetical protein
VVPRGASVVLSASTHGDIDPALVQERGVQRFDLAGIPSTTERTETGKALHR